MTNWTIDHALYTGSDHHCIRYIIQDPRGLRDQTPARQPEGWAIRKLDREKLVDYIREKRVEHAEDRLGDDEDEAVERFHQYVAAGCCRAMPRRGTPHGHRPAYWWNDEIVEKRRLCIRMRRDYQRRGRRILDSDREEERIRYNVAKKGLRLAIKKLGESVDGAGE